MAIRDATRELTANKKQLTELVKQFAPAMLEKVGVGPVSAAQASCPGRTEAGAATRRPLPLWQVSVPFRQAAVEPSGTASIAAAIAHSTAPCMTSC